MAFKQKLIGARRSEIAGRDFSKNQRLVLRKAISLLYPGVFLIHHHCHPWDFFGN